MSMLIPFWVWILLGLVLGWWLRGFVVRKFGFLNKLRKPFGTPKKKKKRPPAASDAAPDEPEEELTGTERIKKAAKKGAGLLAKPWEYLLGGPDDEEDEE